MEKAVAGDAGIIDQDIDRAEVLFDFGEAGGTGVVARHVPLVDRNAGLGFELRRSFIITGVIGGHRIAGGFQRF